MYLNSQETWLPGQRNRCSRCHKNMMMKWLQVIATVVLIHRTQSVTAESQHLVNDALGASSRFLSVLKMFSSYFFEHVLHGARCWRTCRKANCMSNSGNVVLSVSYYIIPWEQVIVRLRFRSFISSKKHHHCPVDIQPANEGCSPTPWGAGRTLPTLNH